MSDFKFFNFEIIKDDLHNSDKVSKNRYFYSPHDSQGKADLAEKSAKTISVRRCGQK